MSNPTQPNEAPPPAAKRKPLAVAVITADAAFHAATVAACADVAGGLTVDGTLPEPAIAAEAHPLYAEALAKAKRYFEKSGQALAITLVQAPSLDAAAEKLAARGTAAGPLGMLYIDAGTTGLERDPTLEDRLEAFYARLGAASLEPLRSPYAVVVHRRTPPWVDGAHVLADRVLERVVAPDAPWLLRTEQLTALVDFVERTFEKPRNHKAALRDLPTTLGDELTRFLGDRAGADWLFFYYTGSSVTPLIDHLERVTRERGVLALRAANEHGLACGALANHLLHERPFLCVIGTAMMDEFRGTLANMRGAGARGFIVCPEADLGSWFTFQGTITIDEDMREAVAARRLSCVYLDKFETMAERLTEAYRLYEEGRGPVVLLITQAIIDSRDPLPQRPTYPERAAKVEAPLSTAQEEALGKALAILNRERTKVLWQLGRLDAEEQDLVHQIAERAGIALVDTLGHPHPSHRNGRRVPHYLGTLGLYGFNQRSYAFLHSGGKLNARAEQCIFFLKSKVGGRATNFTPFRRSGLRMIQLTNRADHVAPDVELALVMDGKDFLRRTLAGLDVDPEVKRFREAAIEAAAPPGVDLASRIPSIPMSPNYFLRELGTLVERMIEEDGYTYTGVYDVGRCSVSATRAVPRTTRGYSGWYGRALMGDAPAALPTMAVTEPGNVLAFVGDGARSIVADPIPPLLDNALAHPSRFDKNVTLFYFSNGTFSGIRTYRERLSGKWGGRQMRTIDLMAPDSEHTFGPLRVVRKAITAFDPAAMREALLARGRLNVFTVLLGHNNDDDGFTFVTAGWQREVL
jgi:thiamine pyrophosphate-dependent acetolactate synthase large subunit-like protein